MDVEEFCEVIAAGPRCLEVGEHLEVSLLANPDVALPSGLGHLASRATNPAFSFLIGLSGFFAAT